MRIGLLAYHAACNFGANLQLLSTFENLKKTTIKDINADLMYNFPEQTPEMIIKDIESVLDLDVRTFDLYSLNVFPNTYMQNYLIKQSTEHTEFTERF